MSTVQAQWSDPRPLLTGVGTLPIARFATVSGNGKETFVVGNDVWVLDRPISLKNTLTIIDQRRRSIVPPPPGDFVGAYPKAIVDNQDRLRLIWAEPQEAPRGEGHWIALQHGAIWTATYTRERSWSVPTRVHVGRIQWGKEISDRFIVTGARSDIRVPEFGSYGIVHLSFEGTSSQVTRISAPTHVAYVTVGRTHDRLVTGFVAANTRASGRDVNSVFFEPRLDELDGTLVSESGRFPALDLKSRVGRDGALHLLWRQTLPSGNTRIRHTVSRDVGTTWSKPMDIEGSVGAHVFDAEVASDGALHVVYGSFEGASPNQRLVHTEFRDGWANPVSLFPTFSASEPALHARHDGSLLLVFLGRDISLPADTRPVSMYSEFTPTSGR